MNKCWSNGRRPRWKKINYCSSCCRPHKTAGTCRVDHSAGDPKGKALETPSRNLKKRKLVKASEREPKKAKLMASAISAAKTVEVWY